MTPRARQPAASRSTRRSLVGGGAGRNAPSKRPRSAARLKAIFQATIIDNPYIAAYDPEQGARVKVYPTQKQAEFLLLDNREAMYGGAAGGGKSVALLMAALMYVDHPRYRAVIFRRTYTMLDQPDGLMDLARQWLSGTDARWSERRKRWTFPSGATLQFAYLDGPKDHEVYQGGAFHFVGFDEGGQMTPAQVRYMFSRCRRRKSEAADNLPPLRVRIASNPGGIGHTFLKIRFRIGEIDPEQIPEGDNPSDRAFVPALLDDNPHIDADGYRENLSELDPITRAQLEHGDWDARSKGELFDTTAIEIIEPHQVPWSRLYSQVRHWDLAATEPTVENPDPDWTAGVWLAWDKHADDWYVIDVRQTRQNPGGVQTFVTTAAYLDGVGVPIVLEREPGSGGKITIHDYQRVLPEHEVHGQAPKGKKEVRARPIASRTALGKLKVVRGPYVAAFLDQLQSFPNGKKDMVDALSGAHTWIAKGGSVKTKNTRPVANTATIIRDGDLVLTGAHHIDK